MREGLTEIVFILDRSGSMSGLEEDTIGGFNSLLVKQKKEDGQAVVSTILFDDRTEVLHDRIDLQKIEPLNDKQYYVRGCTALLDAVGGAIHHLKKIHKHMDKEECPEKTLFIITTDGMENASREYSYKKVKKMVEEQQKKGWEFLFLGANIDAIKTAGDFGIKASHAVNYECDEEGTALNFSVLAETVGMVRRCSAPMIAKALDGGAWKKDIEENYERRHEKIILDE